MKVKDKDINPAASRAWKLFENTGRVSYYLLYKKLTGK